MQKAVRYLHFIVLFVIKQAQKTLITDFLLLVNQSVLDFRL
jgi:hypothetical protein